ncbi:MAG: YciI family protein [Planctomycetaceae bacterium]
MSGTDSSSEYLVISRGQWDGELPLEQIQKAIDEFYDWIQQHIDAGRMKPGQRLASEGRTVSRKPVVMDGPYGETKELIGGYWFIIADSLDDAAELAAGNPCLNCGLFYEIRPIEAQKASAFRVTTETPRESAG